MSSPNRGGITSEMVFSGHETVQPNRDLNQSQPGLLAPRRSINLRRLSTIRTSFSTIWNQPHHPAGSADQRLDPKATLQAALENTYQIAPTPGTQLRSDAVESIIQEVLRHRLASVTYDRDAVGALTREIADNVKVKVKEMGFCRHKVVVHVVLGQRIGQGVQIASRCVWDDRHDNWACASYQGEHVFGVATVHAAYSE